MTALKIVHRCPGTDEPHDENHKTTQTRNQILPNSFLAPDVFKTRQDYFFLAEDMLQFS